MTNFTILPSQKGFRFHIESTNSFWYKFEYTAICAGGSIIYGDISNFFDGSVNWENVPLAEPIMFIGINAFKISNEQSDLNETMQDARSLIHNSVPLSNRTNLDSRIKGDSQYDPYSNNIGQYNPYLWTDNQYLYDATYDPYSDDYDPYLDNDHQYNP